MRTKLGDQQYANPKVNSEDTDGPLQQPIELRDYFN